MGKKSILARTFVLIKKCTIKFDCLVYEMLVNELRPSLNVQSDSTRANVVSACFYCFNVPFLTTLSSYIFHCF